MEWKSIDGLDPRYLISEDGQVSSNGKILKLSNHSKGYKKIALRFNGIKKNFSVHRLVGLAFIEPVSGKNFINHKNGIKDDNRVENLEWCTVKENTKHAYDMGKIDLPCEKFDDVAFLTYATCIRKYRAIDLDGIMTFSNFRQAVRGKTHGGRMAFLKEFSDKHHGYSSTLEKIKAK